MWMFIAALFIVDRYFKQPKSSSVSKWIISGNTFRGDCLFKWGGTSYWLRQQQHRWVQEPHVLRGWWRHRGIHVTGFHLCSFQKGRAMGMGSQSAMPGAGGGGRLTLKRKDGTFLVDGYILSIVVLVVTWLCICKTQFSKRVNFIVCKLYVSNLDFWKKLQKDL